MVFWFSILWTLKQIQAMNQTCPLCNHTPSQDFYQGRLRKYLRCPVCALIFVAREYLLSPKDERARYDLHENDPQDPGYRNFLSKLVTPLLEQLGLPPLSGLDFGSGPGPALAMMLEEQGYNISLYDPYYAPQPEVLEHTYDFVTCTETMEHFYTPGKEWDILVKLVKPGGLLGVMTKLIDEPEKFPDLHYTKDDTHVSFFSRRTFSFLAKKDRLAVEFFCDNVVLFSKPEVTK